MEIAPKQRLTFASMWAFEDIGVREIEEKVQCQCEYSSPEEVLVIKGDLEGSVPSLAGMLCAFIDSQKNKDLLDMPRVRLLELPTNFQDSSSPNPTQDIAGGQKLLSIDDESDEDVAFYSVTRVTKFWLSSDGGIGCFASNSFQDMLLEIAKGTGTEISVINNLKGIQVSGKSANDVDDAMMKLTRIEKPLALLRSPCANNIAVAINEKETRYRVQSYGTLNPLALRRILVNPNTATNIGLGQMFVTVLLVFDDEKQEFILPENLVKPPQSSDEPGTSRIWNDFTFREIGKPEVFLPSSSTTENKLDYSRLILLRHASSHPYLSPEKVKRVDQWIFEGPDIGTNDTGLDSEVEKSSNASPSNSCSSKMVARADFKKTPGIKTRRAVPAVQETASHEPNARKLLNSPVGPNDDTAAPRKRWRTLYTQQSNKTQQEGSSSVSVARDMNANLEASGNSLHSPERLHVERKAFMPTTFDATKYGLNKISEQATKWRHDSPKVQAGGQNTGPLQKKHHAKQTELVDIFTPSDGTTISPRPALPFNHPPLVPAKSTSSRTESTAYSLLINDVSAPRSIGISCDLNGLKFDADTIPNESKSLDCRDKISPNKTDFEVQAARLQGVSKACCRVLTESGSTSATPWKSLGEYARSLEREKLAELGRPAQPEDIQPVDERETRRYHHIMFHKMAKPGENAKLSNLEIRAKRQATLEDAWGITQLQNPQRSAGNLGVQKLSSSKKTKETSITQGSEIRQQNEASMNEYIKSFSEAIMPILEAAEAFPGTLTIEIQVGLILVPLLPKTCSEGSMSPSEWSRIFQPRNGLAAPTTKFCNRVTAFGSDIDRIVDIKTSRSGEKSRIFEQEYSEYHVSYEYHCRTKSDQLLLIVIDEQGKYSIQNPGAMLGAVNIHFPGQTWDARAVVSGSTEYRSGTNPEFEEAAQYLINHLWIQPNKPQIRIFSCLPRGGLLTVEKVLMKRWTRHRLIQENDPAKDQNGQDLFLQVMEAQELFLGVTQSPVHQPLRARGGPPWDMARRGKMWHEVSLVSPLIEAMLKANANLEVGEQTNDWRSTDLFGKDDALPPNQLPNPLSPTAAAIGGAGLVGLFRLARTVVEKIDWAGYWNQGPFSDHSKVVPDDCPESLAAEWPRKEWDFEDLESIKEVQSVTENVSLLATSAARSVKNYETTYW
ncbi:hypothetical protein P175DRAFT_0469446 [Aspergillus ochraceoroseus IBT 24754]|uniref:Uncharacterized protein n=3 Tax=Aspergillus subgen. Nidulantes TaxID=2720870 RepID=A0A0F8V247_9EURO|nr:uncharacterized protein P175DRAFT_0469446 [Aspergillus ochraceoroseus IBT 24754]KKK23914.1 hypothetical protein AOCH_007122 [Aspergillus ochraceoroseus]KKK25829.1 hypothetical protein ARAM_000488 [Aspergillus rambellii]PTU23937.1 hypothetical protein P175DRAFT_0469446 [Aspergillus ochraceoroseus IBT 24754]